MQTYFTRAVFCVTLFCAFQISIFAQNTSISGQINDYTQVESIDYCQSALVVNGTNGFSVGSSVILIQMQGATIEENDNDDQVFGTIFSLNEAGLYEKANIRAIRGDSIFLENQLLNTYNTNSSVQLVSMPSYVNATVADTIKAKPWNGETGGIIAFNVESTLVLNAPIDANGAGFRGGQIESPANDCVGGFNNAPALFYPRNDWHGAPKGEGLRRIIAGKENGRGAQANGGGGGNDHNSGGGGGAHATAGGKGGDRANPGGLRCRGNNPGFGGNPLVEIEDRLFLGGGGGAGHSNNEQVAAAKGGNGGGIIIIETNDIISNSQTIMANGEQPANSLGDGASGGGAGGSIVLILGESGMIIDQLFTEAKGGNGGNVDNGQNANACMGPGGGGSGGRLLSTEIGRDLLNIDVAGGNFGRSGNSSVQGCNNARNEADNGAVGLTESTLVLVEGTNPISEPQIVVQPENLLSCTDEMAMITIEASGAELRYQWQIDRGNGFENLPEGELFSNVNTPSLSINNVTLAMDGNQFRLIVRSECLGETASAPIPLVIESQATVPDFEFELQPGGVVIFNNTSDFAERIAWDFGEGVASASNSTSFTFPAEGDYEVTLTASNECGERSITKTVTVVFEPTAAFDANNAEGCAPLVVDFENQSSENTASFEWIFPSGTPNTSTDANPSVTFQEGGLHDVILIATNELGSDTIIQPEYIFVKPSPTANFIEESLNDDLSIELTNTSINGESFIWDFGDGSPTSTEINPIHTYDLIGTYTITLTATNDCGENTVTREIAVGAAPLANFSSDATSGCVPITVQFIDISDGQRESWSWEFEGGQPATSNEQNPTVTYSDTGSYTVKLIVTNELGQDELVREEFIQVLPPPSPDFNFEAMDGSVSFINLSEGASRYVWSFGDGNVSQEEEPTHEFNRTGLYYVTLNAFNDFCASTKTLAINIIISSLDNLDQKVVAKTYPNPVSDVLTIALEGLSPTRLQLRLMDTQGRILQEQTLNSADLLELNVAEYPAGLYFVQVLGEDWQVTEQVLKE
ncbi:MAG: PKD domain-containing protein [Bacteroidota bacterium]